MLSKIKISTRLTIGFSVVLLFIVTICSANYYGFTRLRFYIQDLAYNHGTLAENGQVARASINMMRRYEKDLYLNIGDAAKVESYKKKWEESLEQLRRVNEGSLKLLSASSDPAARSHLEMLKTVSGQIDGYAAGFGKVYQEIQAGRITTPQDANRAIGEYKEATHKSETLVTEFSAKMNHEMEGMVRDSVTGSNNVLFYDMLLAVFALGLTYLMAFTIVRSITNPLRRLVATVNSFASGDLTAEVEVTTSDELGQLMTALKATMVKLRGIMSEVTNTALQVAASSNQLQSTAVQIATGAEEVASQTGTVATAGEEMFATSSDIANSCQTAAERAGRAKESAQAGAEVVQETIYGMQAISEQVKSAARTVEELGTRSDQIGNIVGTIEDIADQTNLLALNAAIEAARAGEQGRGFAVVADEVRALAERTTKATREIGEMIKAIQLETRGAVAAMAQGVAQVEQGTLSSSRSGEALVNMLDQIADVTQQIHQIATAAEEQSATTSEISTNMSQITDVVAATAQGAAETAAASSTLAQEAQHLQQLVAQFRV
ncbi:methyl-accepting chemotaxis protein [Geomonas limicola]|uniref:Methyl-accepting chemotaxis protein n=1 Tax=Geomonas limicola TaxID=2740186 RepID=A0A6V8N496_9BACT|nr:methyl-accepting chemotaxis protein [Geomonas limicola]GFO67368.1 methyl-accepting chemotaxis protein [Geomonas limicola]